MKNSKLSQKGLKFQYVAMNVACWIEKSLELKQAQKNEMSL